MSGKLSEVAIVGAGLGGLAVAIALQKQGIPVQVYEKAQELKPVGAGLSLFPNGLIALNAIAPGIVDSLKYLGSETYQVNVKKSTGELIVQNYPKLLERYHQPMLNIRWSALQETLAAALSTERIHLNHPCVGFEQDRQGVIVRFANGKTISADLLIGADGINSVIRQQLFQDGSPRYAGRLSWRAIIPNQPGWIPTHQVTIMTGVDGRLFTLIEVGSGQIFWSAGALSAEEFMSETAEAVRLRVLETFAGWAKPVEAIVEATPASAIVERPIYDRSPLQTWSDGRVTLLGDAAHPMVPSLGQGANTAFEDAWELSQFLAHQPTLASALREYENRRIYRTQIIQARSALQGSRSYEADSETFLRGVAEQAREGQAEFEDWLYRYEP